MHICVFCEKLEAHVLKNIYVRFLNPKKTSKFLCYVPARVLVR